MSIVGARPNFMKIAPIAHCIDNRNKTGQSPHILHVVVHTGQHYDQKMSRLFFEQLEIPEPAYNLEVGSGSQAMQTARIMERFEPVLVAEQPDILVLVGDVNSTVACALVAAKTRYAGRNDRTRPVIAHVEAGLRSFDRDMPEEINRILTDALSDLLFVTEQDAIGNLEREGARRAQIHFVGNVMVDNLLAHRDRARRLNTLARILNSDQAWARRDITQYGVVTLHRPSNVDDADSLRPLIRSLENISSFLPLIFPVHPRTRDNLVRWGLMPLGPRGNSIIYTEPLGYLEFLDLFSGAALMVTDSGGIQEEATVLQVPCITLRSNTERPVTIALGTNHLVGTDPDRIVKTAADILGGGGKQGRIPPFWDGKASERILRVLLSASMFAGPALPHRDEAGVVNNSSQVQR